MFWRLGLHTPSSIDLVMGQDSFTLENLMDEDELIQEIKLPNKDLVEYISQPNVITTLINMMLPSEVPDPKDPQSMKYLRYAYQACEIFASDIWVFTNGLFEQREMLLKFLFREGEMSSLLANYFTRAMSVLLEKMTSETMSYLKGYPNLVQALVDNVSVYPMLELILKLVVTENSAEWLVSEGLITKLVEKISPNYSAETHMNASTALTEIIQYSSWTKTAAPLLDFSRSEAVATQLMEILTQAEESASALEMGIQVIINLLQPPPKMEDDAVLMDGTMQNEEKVKEDTERHLREKLEEVEFLDSIKPIIIAVSTSIPFFERLLLRFPGTQRMSLAFGTLEPPVGPARLKVIQLIGSLLRTGSSFAIKAVLSTSILSECLALFFEYSENNFLHLGVQEVLMAVLDGNNDALRSMLFGEDCNMAQRILDGCADNAAYFAHTRLRRGYMGHVINISNSIERCRKDSELVNEFLVNNDQWNAYVTNELATTNADLGKPLGGYRPVASTEESEEEDLFDRAEINDDGKLMSDSDLQFKYFYNRMGGEYSEHFADFDKEGEDQGEYPFDEEFDAGGIFEDNDIFGAPGPQQDLPEDNWPEQEIVDRTRGFREEEDLVPQATSSYYTDTPPPPAAPKPFTHYGAADFYGQNISVTPEENSDLSAAVTRMQQMALKEDGPTVVVEDDESAVTEQSDVVVHQGLEDSGDWADFDDVDGSGKV